MTASKPSGDERDVVERQRADDDCTICAIAMATGLPYERVMEVAAQSVGGYRYQGKPGTMSPKGVLMDLGFEAMRVGVEAIQPATLKRLLWGRRAILSVPSINGFAGHHDVYWDGRVICDPSHKATYAPDALGDLRPIWAVVVDEVSELEALRGERDSLRKVAAEGWIAGEKRVSPVLLERSGGANFVQVVWAVKPGAVRLIAICSNEAHADRYASHLPPGLEGFRSWKESAPIDHAFGFADSMHARVQGKL